MRLALFMLIFLGLACVACTTAGSANRSEVPGNAVTPVLYPTPPGETYWIVSTGTLIGTPYYSGVLQLPTDDKETVAAAVNAWGRKYGQRGGIDSVYPFSRSEEAEKFRSEKGDVVHLDITRNDLIPRLCVGTLEAGTEYWVISIKTEHLSEIPPGWDSNTTYFGKATYTHYISSPLLLPEYSDKAIYRAVTDWGRGREDNANTRKFANVGDAEAFISKSGMEHLDLTAETLDKYLCANQPEESHPTPKPRRKN